ncbi:DUF3180 domain-containing protein [Leifsonia sp. A12D58]|uniref:DUF3180 domain-containing protein n=1 Tax=Leifsonia sp. A12D58 TaxID=3397674 RepID=UPI0039DFD57A
MKRTHPTPVIALALAGLVIGFLIDLGAASFGLPILVPPLTLPLTLAVIGILIVVLAWPIRRSTRDKTRPPVNPFVALRIAVLAKASSLSGSLVLGIGLGIALYVLTRSVVPALSTLWLALATALGAAILLAGGLIAEHFCTLPPRDDDDQNRGDISG